MRYNGEKFVPVTHTFWENKEAYWPISKYFGRPVKRSVTELWAARNEDGTLLLFREKPYLIEPIGDSESYWVSKGTGALILPESLFPELSLENSPVRFKVTFVPIKNEV